ncbi:MAG: phosphoribosyl-ATP diphosphatase [Alphaproteobacteria bacterium TMED62]|nr:MAG: phosphoribosyl-ATP diphosphatase [Alphaproteobacteria bacterium TMED62]|tara:strand:- start:7250 stop:7549 length:300 start_codon:yes stop_codon:yes gene_type:complete
MTDNENKLCKILAYLEKIIKDKKSSKGKSYTAELLSQGTDRISQKVGEEAIEVVIASNNKKKKQVIYESADLIFHLLVLWKKLGIKNNDIAEELLRRKK